MYRHYTPGWRVILSTILQGWEKPVHGCDSWPVTMGWRPRVASVADVERPRLRSEPRALARVPLVNARGLVPSQALRTFRTSP